MNEAKETTRNIMMIDIRPKFEMGSSRVRTWCANHYISMFVQYSTRTFSV